MYRGKTRTVPEVVEDKDFQPQNERFESKAINIHFVFAKSEWYVFN